jgi:DNA invertase Pin-like site-specific DNA recombinase
VRPAFADFETNLRKGRQFEAIAAAKARGTYKGRKPSIDVEEVRKPHAGGQGGTEVARRLGISRESIPSLRQMA